MGISPFCWMSAFSRNNGGWKRGFTLHLTQSNHPEKSSPCLLPLALDRVSVRLQAVPQLGLMLQSLCWVVRAASWWEYMAGKVKEGN